VKGFYNVDTLKVYSDRLSNLFGNDHSSDITRNPFFCCPDAVLSRSLHDNDSSLSEL